MSRGYGEVQVSRQLKEGYKMPREEALKRAEKKEDKRINFVTTHSAYLPNINKILKRHGHFLKEEGLDKCIKETPRPSLRREFECEKERGRRRIRTMWERVQVM